MKKERSRLCIQGAEAVCGRWGEADKEKGPADLFPTEPTIEPRQGEETLRPWAQGSPRPDK